MLDFLDLTFEADKDIESLHTPADDALPIHTNSSTSFSALAANAVDMIQATLPELQYVAMIDTRSIITQVSPCRPPS